MPSTDAVALKIPSKSKQGDLLNGFLCVRASKQFEPSAGLSIQKVQTSITNNKPESRAHANLCKEKFLCLWAAHQCTTLKQIHTN